MPELDVPEVVTRKVGPLPAWGWVAAIGGAYVVYRIASGPGGSTGTVVGGTPTSFGDGSDPDTGDSVFEGPNSLVAQLQTQVGKLGSIQELQTKLAALLNQRSSLLYTRNSLITQRNGLNDQRRACKTTSCRKSVDAKIAGINKQLTTNNSALTALNTQISELQKQITALGAS